MKKRRSSADFLFFILLSSLLITLVTFSFMIKRGWSSNPSKTRASVAEISCPEGTAPVHDCTRILAKGNKCFWRCEPGRLIPSEFPSKSNCPWIICPKNCLKELDSESCNRCNCPY